MNTKGQTLSKSALLMIILVFYAVVIVFVGYINSYYNQTFQATEQPYSDFTNNDNLSFLDTVINGITDLPTWVNIILFGTLTITVGFIIVTSLPLWNGGS